jgi:hypothetical protein
MASRMIESEYDTDTGSDTDRPQFEADAIGYSDLSEDSIDYDHLADESSVGLVSAVPFLIRTKVLVLLPLRT